MFVRKLVATWMGALQTTMSVRWGGGYCSAIQDRGTAPRLSGRRRTAVHEMSGGGIPRRKRTTIEFGVPHGIHGVDPADNTGVTQIPQDYPQDHVDPGYVRDWAVCRPLHRYRGRELIAANTNHPGK